jgi:hypothetical protein
VLPTTNIVAGEGSAVRGASGETRRTDAFHVVAHPTATDGVL